jgi:hypothetical protein
MRRDGVFNSLVAEDSDINGGKRNPQPNMRFLYDVGLEHYLDLIL